MADADGARFRAGAGAAGALNEPLVVLARVGVVADHLGAAASGGDPAQGAVAVVAHLPPVAQVVGLIEAGQEGGDRVDPRRQAGGGRDLPGDEPNGRAAERGGHLAAGVEPGLLGIPPLRVGIGDPVPAQDRVGGVAEVLEGGEDGGDGAAADLRRRVPGDVLGHRLSPEAVGARWR